MAIAFDAFTDGSGAFSGELTLTYSHTTTGSNRCLVVATRTIHTLPSGDVVTGITYAGTAMTQAIKKPWPPHDGSFTYLYYLVNPASGANNVVVSVSSNDNQFTSACGSYTGVLQSGTPDTGFTSEDAVGDRTVSVTVSASNSWLVLGSFISADAGPTAVVNGIKRQSGVVDSNPSFFDSNGPVGSGAQTIGLNWAAQDRHIMVALAIAPTGGGTRSVLASARTASNRSVLASGRAALATARGTLV